MKQEHYIKVVNDVVQRMERHADVVMNVKQVAEYLGLSVGAVRKRCQRKQLPYHLSVLLTIWGSFGGRMKYRCSRQRKRNCISFSWRNVDADVGKSLSDAVHNESPTILA